MIIKQWKMNTSEHKGILCNAPCSLLSVLLDNGLIDDPFYGRNEKNEPVFYR